MDPELEGTVPRGARVAVGLLAAAVAAFTLLVVVVNVREWFLVPLSRELSPLGDVLAGAGSATFVWFWCIVAYRLLLDRPNRQGGLFSSRFLHGAALVSLLATLVLVAAPAVRWAGECAPSCMVYRCRQLAGSWRAGARPPPEPPARATNER